MTEINPLISIYLDSLMIPELHHRRSFVQIIPLLDQWRRTAFRVCSQPPPQIIINANSSADKTNPATATEKDNSRPAEIDGQNPVTQAAARDVTTSAPPPLQPPAVQTAAAAFGTCYWNGAPEQCTAQWSGQTVSVRWASDGKVTRYDFKAGTVFDTDGRTYQATRVDLAQGA